MCAPQGNRAAQRWHTKKVEAEGCTARGARFWSDLRTLYLPQLHTAWRGRPDGWQCLQPPTTKMHVRQPHPRLSCSSHAASLQYDLLGQGACKKVYKALDEEEGIEVAWNIVQVCEFGSCDKEHRRLVSQQHQHPFIGAASMQDAVLTTLAPLGAQSHAYLSAAVNEIHGDPPSRSVGGWLFSLSHTHVRLRPQLDEIKVLSALKHKHIMQLFDWWHDTKNGTLNFVTELFNDGTLRQ